MSNVFRYLAAASTGISASNNKVSASAQPATRRRDESPCNYDNNYYGDQVCQSCKVDFKG